MELIKREHGRKSEIFKGSKKCSPVPQPPWEDFSYVVKRNKKNVVALLTGKITVKLELSLIGLKLILNIDMVI